MNKIQVNEKARSTDTDTDPNNNYKKKGDNNKCIYRAQYNNKNRKNNLTKPNQTSDTRRGRIVD